MKAFFRLMLLALVLLVVALVSALTAMRFAIHGREVAVPDLVGKLPADARRMAEAGELQMEVERQYYSPTVPEGRVLSQLPLAGTQVRRGWKIRVAESLGPQRVQIPDVTGDTERVAQINIRRRGLDVGTVAHLQIPGTLPGTLEDRVVSQSPPPNASGVAAPKISMLIAEASQPQAFVMPRLIGQPLGVVTIALQAAGLRLGTVTLAGHDGNPFSPPLMTTPQASAASLIVSQSPAPGEKVMAGAAINFAVRQ